MSPFDPRTRSHPTSNRASPSPPEAQQDILTTTGVRVIVKPPPPSPEPRPAPEPWPCTPTAIILPESLSPEDRERFMTALFRQYGPLIDKMVARWRDILPASAEDMRQRVLLILFEKMQRVEPIGDVEGWLAGVVLYEVRHRHRYASRQPQIDREAAPDEQLSDAGDPERAAHRAAQTARLEGYLDRLPPKEAEVFRCAELEGMTLEAIADRLGRPRSTVGDQLDRAWTKLKDMARASERG